ncbi:hypothetical protein AK830_g1272 [Neonectria ditissima]|uniref:Protein kinase domain-containing protein n=1 Tax=Neonectria ditissima TaxID=78410 RepID=A0A0P7BV43_9HYPO|nr:hypothetical protein AK830_g1272 [Neonectria ditissima]
MTESPSSEHACDVPYPVGQILSLKAILNDATPKTQSTLRERIKRQNQPWTLSCGMIVETVEDPIELHDSAESFLKLFDRRYAHQLRDDNGIEPWSDSMDEELLSSVQSGKAEEFLGRLRADKEFKEETEEDWDAAENEAFLGAEISAIFDAELSTYTKLRAYQGNLIPRLLAEVSLDTKPASPDIDDRQHLFQVKGVLLEYLEGFSLSTMAQHAPQSSWQDIVDQAIKIVHILGDNNILNRDIRPDNFVVVPQGGKDEDYHVFMIDFGQCRFRENESDAEWGRAKWVQDEEGAVGVVMKGMLKRAAGFQLHYEPSLRYLEWAPGEDD